VVEKLYFFFACIGDERKKIAINDLIKGREGPTKSSKYKWRQNFLVRPYLK